MWPSLTRHTRSRPSRASIWESKISSLGVDLTLSRLYNERTQQGPAQDSPHRRGDSTGEGSADRRPGFLRARCATGIGVSLRGSMGGFACRSGGPRPCRKSCASSAPRSARAPNRSRPRPRRSSSTPRRSDAGRWRMRFRTGCIRPTPKSVSWVEVEERIPAPRPTGLGPARCGSRLCDACCSSSVPTCVLTSATLCVGKPPRFDFIESRLGDQQCREPCSRQPVRLRPPGDGPSAARTFPTRPLNPPCSKARPSGPSRTTSSRLTARRSSCSRLSRCSTPPHAS